MTLNVSEIKVGDMIDFHVTTPNAKVLRIDGTGVMTEKGWTLFTEIIRHKPKLPIAVGCLVRKYGTVKNTECYTVLAIDDDLMWVKTPEGLRETRRVANYYRV